ncbi:MAG: 4'-phosphopantetheinyl transferase superfamily protein [Blastocatellia bacterium]
MQDESDMVGAAQTSIDEWGFGSVGDELGADDAHVWRAALDQPAEMIAKLTPLLSRDEYQRAERFHRPTDRWRFIAGRGILRKIISAYLALAPDEVQFVYNEYGKPFISTDQNRGALSFNLSHSNDIALYAVTRRRRVGIDVEHMREDFATIDVTERFFSKDEAEALKAVPMDQRTKAFFNCWSRKEAYIKAIGMGVSYPLDGFTVSLAPNVAPALLKVDADAAEAARWNMYELDAGEGYAAALIVENSFVSLRRFQMDLGPTVLSLAGVPAPAHIRLSGQP